MPRKVRSKAEIDELLKEILKPIPLREVPPVIAILTLLLETTVHIRDQNTEMIELYRRSLALAKKGLDTALKEMEEMAQEGEADGRDES